MFRRWKIWMLAFCLLVIVLCGLESQRILTGWLRGEAFYRGRPTSYWRERLERWYLILEFRHQGEAGEIYYGRHQLSDAWQGELLWISKNQGIDTPRICCNWVQQPTKRDNWFKWILASLSLGPPPFLDGDPNALPVLEELAQDGSPGVQFLKWRILGQDGLPEVRFLKGPIFFPKESE